MQLYGVISSESWWGDEVTPKQFKADLDALGDIDLLNVYVNSEGGDVFAGQSIRSMLKRHKATVHGYVDGLAASIASVIMTGCDKVYMPRNAMQMVHKPWTWGAGNASDFRKLADDLDQIEESIIAAYQEKTGLDREKIVELLEAETWLTAEEAKAMGFCDEIEESKAVAACLKEGRLVVNGQQVDLSRYRNAPKLAFLPVADGSENPVKPPPDPLETPAEPGQDPGVTLGELPTNQVPAQRSPNVAPLSLFSRRLQMNERGM